MALSACHSQGPGSALYADSRKSQTQPARNEAHLAERCTKKGEGGRTVGPEATHAGQATQFYPARHRRGKRGPMTPQTAEHRPRGSTPSCRRVANGDIPQRPDTRRRSRATAGRLAKKANTKHATRSPAAGTRLVPDIGTRDEDPNDMRGARQTTTQCSTRSGCKQDANRQPQVPASHDDWQQAEHRAPAHPGRHKTKRRTTNLYRASNRCK